MIISPSVYALLWAVYVKGRDGRVVRGLLREEGDFDFAVCAGIALVRGDAGSATLRCAVGMLEEGVGVFDLPVTLLVISKGGGRGRS
jgi:hypothetical protein